MTASQDELRRPADVAYGYPFGCDGFVRIPEAADLLRVHRGTVYRLINAGKLRKGRIGSMSRICKRSLLEFMNSVEE